MQVSLKQVQFNLGQPLINDALINHSALGPRLKSNFMSVVVQLNTKCALKIFSFLHKKVCFHQSFQCHLSFTATQSQILVSWG